MPICIVSRYNHLIFIRCSPAHRASRRKPEGSHEALGHRVLVYKLKPCKHEELVVGNLHKLRSIIELPRTFPGTRSEDSPKLAVRLPKRDPAARVRARYIRAVAKNQHGGVGRYTFEASYEADDLAEVDGAEGRVGIGPLRCGRPLAFFRGELLAGGVRRHVTVVLATSRNGDDQRCRDSCLHRLALHLLWWVGERLKMNHGWGGVGLPRGPAPLSRTVDCWG